MTSMAALGCAAAFAASVLPAAQRSAPVVPTAGSQVTAQPAARSTRRPNGFSAHSTFGCGPSDARRWLAGDVDASRPLPRFTASASPAGARDVRCLLDTNSNAVETDPRARVDAGELRVSPIGCGTWSWGNQLLWGYDPSQDEELERVFNFLVDSGVNFFDTGDSYGTGKLEGRSEVLLGRFLRNRQERLRSEGREPEEVYLATKLALYPWRLTRGSFMKACRASLARMGIERMGMAQAHWSAANYSIGLDPVVWDALADMREAGLVEAVGVSNYGPRQLRRCHAALARRGVRLSSVQVQYSLLSTAPEASGLLETAAELGVRVIAYSPLALGLCTGKYGPERPPPGLRGFAFRAALQGCRPVVSTLREVAAARGKTASQVALNWCMQKGTTPIPGAKSAGQARENAGAMGWALSPAEVAALDDAARRAGATAQMTQNVFQSR
eukprot:tig00020934_g16090.t1